jgi:hypothetical protein
MDSRIVDAATNHIEKNQMAAIKETIPKTRYQLRMLSD